MAKHKEEIAEDEGQEDRTDGQEKAPWLIAALACKDAERPKKLQVYVDLDCRRRIEVASVVEGLDFSVIVNGLIKAHLKNYYAGLRGGKKVEAA